MRSHIATVTAFWFLAPLATFADTAPGPAARAVPKSVLQELGLGDLVVIPTEDHAADLPDPVPEPGQPKVDEPAVASPPPNRKRMEAREELLVGATAGVQSILNKMEMAAKALSKAKSDLALAKKTVSRHESDLAKARQRLDAARASVEPLNQKIAEITLRVTALGTEGKKIALVFAAQTDLIARLGSIRGELKEVADTFNDSQVAHAGVGLAKFITVRQEENARRKEVLTAKAREFENAKRALLAARREAEPKQKEVTLAESVHNDLNRRLMAARNEVRQKQNAVARAESVASELAAAHQAARGRLRAANLAAKTVDDE